MANNKNLIPQAHKLTVDEQSAGGKASAEARKKKRDLRLALEMLLEKDFKDKQGNSVSGAEAITTKLFEQAMKGNVKAFETIRATVGQDPVQKVEQVNIDAEYRQSVDYVRGLMENDNE